MKMHIIFILLHALNPFAFGSSFYIRPISEVTLETRNIVRGVVREVYAENATAPEGGKTVYTYAILDVKDVMKGGIHSGEIKVRRLGGTKDGVTLEIPGSPEFKKGEETVLFLSDEKEDQSYEVSEMELGKFGIEDKGGESFLRGGLLAFSRTPDHAGEGMVDEGAKSENLRPWSLKDLKSLIAKQGTNLNERASPTPNSSPDVTQNQTSPSVAQNESPTPAATNSTSIPATTTSLQAHPLAALLAPFICTIAIFLLILFLRNRRK